ncbi:uncharacterized protein LOC112343005 isoform X1 [Selaginella moellendorffii]|uniref:uncharacterized protein LOC112343005 isoform X1 n=1 Tax=Selaginella moellendorffii TaxID=88036 RepID=UPI000D1CF647|nr:uncharacterized protein LOC112343005 isoform X1 [Selaginella moellendorffii]|eukprot:XP_024521531.1 uncharacterized protein LOC112343005 isoform X1 [Selaginella moellendorffii]
MARVDISLGYGALDGQVLGFLARELIAFVLYMHQQMPRTFDQMQIELRGMEGSVRDETTRKSLGKNLQRFVRKTKKLHKFLDCVERLMVAVESAINSTAPGVVEIVLLIGSNVARPQVVYRLKNFGELSDSSSSAEKTKIDLKQLTTKMIRELLSSGITEKVAGPTKLFLLVKASPEFMPTLSENFLPKRAFTWNSAKASEISIDFLRGESLEEANSEKIWYWNYFRKVLVQACCNYRFQCRHFVKGQPSSKELC